MAGGRRLDHAAFANWPGSSRRHFESSKTRLALIPYTTGMPGPHRRGSHPAAAFTPSALIDAHWRQRIVDPSRDRLDCRADELSAAYELR